MNADRVIALVCGMVGAYWAINGWLSLGLWINKGPGPGFLPVIFGSFTVLLCIAHLLKKGNDAEPVDLQALIPVAAIIVYAAAIHIIGFLPASFVLIFLWVIKQGGYSFGFSFLLAASVTVSIWGIFGYWLQVPFPLGLFDF